MVIVTPHSIPIDRASSGGLAHVIFNLPSRIAIRGYINLFCRDAKLKMLCQMCSSTFSAVTPHAGICAGGGSSPRTKSRPYRDLTTAVRCMTSR
jgi:hypothetical protein